MKKLIFTLLAFAVGLTTYAQTTLKGTIIDNDSNEALIGASVLLSGTSSGTVTDIDGNFELNTDQTTGTLEISYTGYESIDLDFYYVAGAVGLGGAGAVDGPPLHPGSRVDDPLDAHACEVWLGGGYFENRGPRGQLGLDWGSTVARLWRGCARAGCEPAADGGERA